MNVSGHLVALLLVPISSADWLFAAIGLVGMSIRPCEPLKTGIAAIIVGNLLVLSRSIVAVQEFVCPILPLFSTKSRN
jgi:hypothetical protein